MFRPGRWYRHHRTGVWLVVWSAIVWGGAAALLHRFALMPAQSDATLELPDNAVVHFLPPDVNQAESSIALISWKAGGNGPVLLATFDLRSWKQEPDPIAGAVFDDAWPSVDGRLLIGRQKSEYRIFDLKHRELKGKLPAPLTDKTPQVMLAVDQTVVYVGIDEQNSGKAAIRSCAMDGSGDIALVRSLDGMPAFAPNGSGFLARDSRAGKGPVDWHWHWLPATLGSVQIEGSRDIKQWFVSPDGATLAGTTGVEAIFWAVENNSERLATANPDMRAPFVREPVTGSQIQVRFTPAGNRWAVCSGDGVLAAFTVFERDGKAILRRDGAFSPTFNQTGNRIAYLAWHGPTKKDKALFLHSDQAGDRLLRVYSSASGESAVTILSPALPERTIALSWSQTVSQSNSSSKGSSPSPVTQFTEYQIVDTSSGHLIAWLPGGNGVQISPDGRWLVTRGKVQPWLRWIQKQQTADPVATRVYDLSSRSKLILVSQWPIALIATLTTHLFVWRRYLRRWREQADERSRKLERFERVKKSGNVELIRQFLRRNDDLEPRQVCDLLLVDLDHRWKLMEPVAIGDYLRQWTGVSGVPELVLLLLVADARCARSHGRPARHEEVLEEYPGIREAYHQRLLSSGSTVDALAPAESVRGHPEPAREPLRMAAAGRMGSTATQEGPVTVDYLPPTETYQKPAPDAQDDPDATRDQAPVADEEDSRPLKRIGRYQIEGMLGEGAFATVYLAVDDELNRQVAIKVPKRSRIATPEDVQAYLDEARVVAALDHPAIVPVYDVGRTDDGLCFVVSKYIPGSDLARRLKNGPLPVPEAAGIAIRAAEALQHAHDQGLVHRDIKPANLLIDAKGNCYVADFGLAMRGPDREGRIAGTPAYMSPEQARGANKRLDGRSDLFSLGVVLFEMLTGQRPFQKPSLVELLDDIALATPRLPHQVNPRVPVDLSRLCMRCLAKLPDDRWTTAGDFAQALRRWSRGQMHSVADSLSPQARDWSLPEHGRPFEASDGHIYLELMSPDGVADSAMPAVRFWNGAFESTQWRAGVLAGPAGAGKTSFLRAGLLPRLTRQCIAIQVDGSESDLPLRLRAEIVKAVPEASDASSLVEIIAAISRREPSESTPGIAIIVDHFERWQLGHGDSGDSTLANLVRRVEGPGCKFLFVVRDEFLADVQTFFRKLNLPLSSGEHLRRLESSAPEGARQLLGRIGYLLGRLPESPAEWSIEQTLFLGRSLSDLTSDGRVLPIRLGQLAAGMRDRAWTATSYSQRGGFEGIVFQILNERFALGLDVYSRRLHAIARAILGLLAPRDAADPIRFVRLSEIRKLPGPGGDVEDIDDVLRILDAELRFVVVRRTADGEVEYGLADGSILPGIRRWIGQKLPHFAKMPGAGSLLGELRLVSFLRDLIRPGAHVRWYERIAAWLTALSIILVVVWIPWIVIKTMILPKNDPVQSSSSMEWWEVLGPGIAVFGSIILLMIARFVGNWRRTVDS